MLRRLCVWRLFLLAFLILGIITYQLDLYDSLFLDALDLLASMSCSDKTSSYTVLRELTALSSSTRCSDSQLDYCAPALAITGNGLGGRYLGLGNQMFVFASLYGIARSVGADLITVCRYAPKVRVFDEFDALSMDKNKRLSEILETKRMTVITMELASGNCCTYENVTANISAGSPFDYDLISINGYLQSWKYFHQYKADIDYLFRFKSSVVDAAAVEFRRLIGDGMTADMHFGCVHVRRGDLLRKSSRQLGYVHSDSETVRKAIQYLNRTLTIQEKKFRILLFSDDPEWCLQEFGGFDSALLIARQQSASIAMQMMSEYCDTFFLASSMSTFGWWASYLSKRSAEVYYNAQIAIPGSVVEKQTVKEDYFLPEWIPVDISR